jgi:soluble lytic murein transglycosylase-like protein
MRELAKKEAIKNGLDPDLVFAIIKTESNWNPFAIRYEAHFKYLYEPRALAQNYNISMATMEIMQKCSFGLMQIMCAVAYELGFRDTPAKLFDPQINLEWGCKKLRQLSHRYGSDESKIVSAYNMGSAIKLDSGMFKNQIYVDKVYSELLNLRKLA